MTQINGADATSVATCVVNAVRSAEGTRAKPTQDARDCQFGVGLSPVDVSATGAAKAGVPARRTHRKQAASASTSVANPAVHTVASAFMPSIGSNRKG